MSEFNNTRLQAERTFVSTAILTGYGVESFDAQHDFLLREGINTFLQAYRENQNYPGLIDLKELKKKISTGSSGDIELFMINKKGVIDFATYDRIINLISVSTPVFLLAREYQAGY